MIPASVTPSVSANASSAGALFPLMEPTSAELAEFDQLLGDFNQGSSITALSAPALTLSHGASFATSNQAKTPTTPEDLLATLEQGAQLAFQTPQIAMVIPTNQSLTDEQTMPLSVPLLGDNKAVVFASVPSVSVASTGIMQAASSGVEMPSTSQMLNSLASASAIIANPTAGSGSGATQQDQRQASSQSDRLMPSSEETQSISDVELGADEFSLLSTTPLSQTASQSILSAPLNLRQPQWAQDVAQRVQVMINQSMDELEVRLDPLGLGPMKIGLKLDEQQKAHVTLSAQHGVTREMLENALPRLKELLAQEGIELASATVDSGEKQTGNEQNSAQSSHQSASGLSEDAANTTVSMTVTSSSEHLVDQFA